ncbi:hypothetical protein Cgig2_014963 [Carnegiea gigantea]|uniref:Uncharacterized protein n=1 Tax=Carnegiea gigantea TaxID=171969 RepID=A0A9Q1GLE6_9CARY|nr:hypothetical protein Cgig2_014963 [Carnegiea gigantea]
MRGGRSGLLAIGLGSGHRRTVLIIADMEKARELGGGKDRQGTCLACGARMEPGPASDVSQCVVSFQGLVLDLVTEISYAYAYQPMPLLFFSQTVKLFSSYSTVHVSLHEDDDGGKDAQFVLSATLLMYTYLGAPTLGKKDQSFEDEKSKEAYVSDFANELVKSLSQRMNFTISVSVNVDVGKGSNSRGGEKSGDDDGGSGGGGGDQQENEDEDGDKDEDEDEDDA